MKKNLIMRSIKLDCGLKPMFVCKSQSMPMSWLACICVNIFVWVASNYAASAVHAMTWIRIIDDLKIWLVKEVIFCGLSVHSSHSFVLFHIKISNAEGQMMIANRTKLFNTNFRFISISGLIKLKWLRIDNIYFWLVWMSYSGR